MAKKDKHNSMLERAAARGLIGSAVGGLQGGAHGAGIGAIMGGGGQALGDALLGVPEEHHMLGEGARGALGGALLGAPMGVVSVGKHPQGQALLKFLMSKGMSKGAAAAALLGGGAIGGALGGGAAGGIDSALIHGLRSNDE